MLTILPVKDEAKLKELISEYTISGENPDALIMEQSGTVLGLIVISLAPGAAFIDGIKLFDNACDYDLEALIRAAGSYAVNRRVLNLVCGKPFINESPEYRVKLIKIGFKEKDGSFLTELAELFKPCGDRCSDFMQH